MNRAARRARGRRKGAAQSTGILFGDEVDRRLLNIATATVRAPASTAETVETILLACKESKYEQAAAIARRILVRDPNNLSAALLLTRLLSRIGMRAEACDMGEWLCERDMGVDALVAWVDALFRDGKIDAALDLILWKLRGDPKNALLLSSASNLYIHAGQYKPAYEYMWRLFKVNLAMPEGHHRIDKQPWRGEYLGPEKTLLLYDSHAFGLGDSLSHMRFVRAAKERSGARVLFECQPPTARLAQTSSGADAVFPARPRGSVSFDAEYCLSTFMLPAALGVGLEDIDGTPYVTADEAAVQEWRAKMPAEGLNCGICWHGEKTHAADYPRSTKLEMWEGLRSIPGVNWFSLQFNEPLTAAWNPIGGIGGTMDFADTAAAVSALDLVVTVETSVAHLAGALGKEAWVLTPDVTDFRWERSGPRTPWYNSVMLYRQPRARDWQSVFARVAADLTKKAAEFRR